MHARFLALLFVLLAGCSVRDGGPASRSEPSLLLTGGFIVDPSSSEPPVRSEVLIAGARILAVGPSIRAPAGTRRIDVSGRYLTPALWDMHAHVAAVGPAGNALEDYVAHGVLAIRDMGGREEEVFQLKREIAEGTRLGPTMFVVGPTLNGEAAADFHRPVRSAEEARLAVRAIAAAGADFIKIHRRTSREAFGGVRAEAKARGLKFGGHVPLAMNWIEAAEAGMATMEHVQTLLENEVDEGSEQVKGVFDALDRLEGERGAKIFSAMARNGTYWDPTLIYYESSWAVDPPARRALKQRAYARMQPLVGRAFRAGVPILAGTDLLERRGAGLQDELERLVGAGLTPRQALAAATLNPRRLIGKGPGAIEPGNEASLIVLDSDPLANIGNVRLISALILRGKLLDSAALARLRAGG